MEAAQSLIREYVREIGGVDGVMGFSQVRKGRAYGLNYVLLDGPYCSDSNSPLLFFLQSSLPTLSGQGAALAASMILHDEIAGRTPIFRMAIFICSPVPFSYSLQYGIDTRTYFGLQADAPIRPGCPCKVPEYLITDKAYLQGEEGEDDVSATYYQMFHPTVDTVRINIPTAHIYGRKDPWRRHSLDLVRLCRKEGTSVYEHSSGHVIPKQDDEEEEMCNVIETAMASIAAV